GIVRTPSFGATTLAASHRRRCPMAVTTELATANAAIAPAPRRPRTDWRRACRCLRELLNNPDATANAFEIFDAIDGDNEERNFQKFCAHPQGQRLVRERPSLAGVLSDREALAHMPDGSFGRAYLAYLERTGLEPLGLLQLKAELEAQKRASGACVASLDAAREWFRDRGLLTHDLWHVLTDYGTDGLGEALLLPFSYAQGGGRANVLLVLGVACRGFSVGGIAFERALLEAWRRGRRAVWLPALPYQELL